MLLPQYLDDSGRAFSISINAGWYANGVLVKW